MEKDNNYNIEEMQSAESTSLAWTEVQSEHIVQDEWIDFCRVRYRFPDGTEFEPYYRYSRKNYVVIVAQDENDNYLCVRQYRQGIRRITVEFPAGGIEIFDRGAAKTEPEFALDAAKRELREETGYRSDDWQHLLTVPSNPTMADNFAYVFYAGKCKKQAELHLDETEFLEPEIYSEGQIQDLIREGTFAQPIHIMAMLLAKSRNEH